MKDTTRWTDRIVPRACFIALIIALFMYLNYGPWHAPLGYNKWVWYGGFYTLIVLIMGIYVIRKYHNAYVTRRTLTLMTIQLLPNFLLANFILQDWRAGVLILPWPLAGPHHFLGKGILSVGKIDIDLFWYGIVFLALLCIAVFVYGRRVQCSWICPYGALAETLGDPLRDHAPKGKVYDRWECLSVVIFGFALGMTVWLFWDLWLAGGLEGLKSAELMQPRSNNLPMTLYKMFVSIGLTSIVAISMYPVFGGRIWCRFFCPAGRLFRWIGDKGKTVITGSKEECINCSVCTHVCEMGIDVREYVQSGRPITQGICVGCGICIASCPRGNLHFTSLSEEMTRQGPLSI